MAKQKRKISKATEKKNKKLKKASAKEVLLMPGTASDEKEVHPEAHTNRRDPHVLQVCLGPSRAASSKVLEVNPAPSLSPGEQRTLERKLKKERKKEEKQRLREAGSQPAPQTPATPTPVPSGATLALDYLCSWAQKHQDWKFQKTRQTWLLVNMYDSDKKQLGDPALESRVRQRVPQCHWFRSSFTLLGLSWGRRRNIPAAWACLHLPPLLPSLSDCMGWEQVPDEHFPTLLAYLEGLKGQARELTVQKAEARMQVLDEAGAGNPDPLLLGQVQRVRQVLQLLS
ncbi:uncharacterized protein C7orf50 homolog [Elephas maximus indicus]|uniref:uncharacterized protein C7orf50 homolog n=1 Tax=Elephas maximus indicus TaxID=99487 RepID=UPI0021169BCD|nr:uncharacterized protein C7orf50 homolog [Elephas maximus indicus]